MEEFLGKRDYTGAMAVLEFNRHSGQGSEEVLKQRKQDTKQGEKRQRQINKVNDFL